MTILATSVAAGALLTSCATPTNQMGDAAAAGSTANTLSAVPGSGQSTLSQGIQDGLTGLALEAPENRERITRQARDFASVRGKGGKGAALRKSRVDQCRENPSDAYDVLFCRLWLEASGKRNPGPKPALSLSRSPGGRKRLGELKSAIQNARIEQLATATDSELREALKKAPHVSKLRPLIEKALDNKACVPTTLLTGLGQKTEENFPDADYKDLAQALYSRAVECGNDEAAGKGAYRLGLLQIWDEKYAEAEKTLEWLTRNPAAVDYRSRITYWRYFCAKQTGNIAVRDQMKESLSKDYHLTLHGLITVGPKSTENKPVISFSSVTHPQFNANVRVAEALLEQGLERDAISALEPILDTVSAAEPAFQLYVGLVLKRADDSIRKFRLLTGLYRDYPGLISRESLEMLYPLHRFDMISHYKQKADPYLMISLIRQESAFNDRARSPVGARGLMQLMPRTARRMELVSKNQLFDPKTNIRLGVRFYSLLSNRYGGEAELALAAYNAGPMNVDSWQIRYPVSNRMLFVDLIPFRETREYVASIARNYFWYKRLYEEVLIVPTSTPLDPASVIDRMPAFQPKFTFFKLFDS